MIPTNSLKSLIASSCPKLMTARINEEDIMMIIYIYFMKLFESMSSQL